MRNVGPERLIGEKRDWWEERLVEHCEAPWKKGKETAEEIMESKSFCFVLEKVGPTTHSPLGLMAKGLNNECRVVHIVMSSILGGDT